MDLKKLRKKWDLTQKQMGQAMGMGQRQISRLETGKRMLTIQQKNHLFVLQFLAENRMLGKLIKSQIVDHRG